MNKRKLILAVCFVAITAVSNAQVKKVFAYKQASIPGNIISTDDNDLKEKSEARSGTGSQNFNYWFYLSIPIKEKVSVTGLWINNHQYDIKSETVNKLPVKKIIFTGLEKNDTIIMVPATSNKILLIHPAAKKQGNSKNALNIAKQNELVIRYTWRGKMYYATVKKIKELAPDVRV